MEWQKLDLAKASVIKKEVDHVIMRVNDMLSNPLVTAADRGSFLQSIQSRIQDLEDFYLAFSDDERAVLFEKERLRLRKAVQPLLSGSSGRETRDRDRDGRSLSGQSGEFNQSGHFPNYGNGNVMQHSVSGAAERSVASVSQNRYGNNNNNNNNMSANNSRGAPAENRSAKSLKNSISSAATNRSVASTGSKRAPQPIYSWEEKSEKHQRDEIIIDGLSFVPTAAPGIFARQFQDEEAEEVLSDRYIDFQIILTHEEMTALAARKKSEKPDVKLAKNLAASTSVHATTPYVDPKRISQDMLRPGQPDRWIHPDGMKPFMK